MLFLFGILFYLCPLSDLGVTLHNCTQRKTCREQQQNELSDDQPRRRSVNFPRSNIEPLDLLQ